MEYWHQSVRLQSLGIEGRSAVLVRRIEVRAAAAQRELIARGEPVPNAELNGSGGADVSSA